MIDAGLAVGHPARRQQGAHHQGDKRHLPCEAENPLHGVGFRPACAAVKPLCVAGATRNMK